MSAVEAPDAQRSIDDLAQSLLAQRLLAFDSPHSARTLADHINADLPRLVRAPFFHPLSRRHAERLLCGLPDVFEHGEMGWSMTPAYRAELSSNAGALLAFSPVQPQATERPLHRWQTEALERWVNSGRRGIVAAVTGAGKTMLGMAAIEQHVRLPNARAVVLVPTIELMHQWRAELQRRFFLTIGTAGDSTSDRLEDSAIIVFVARSASEWLVPAVTRLQHDYSVLLVADECHRYGAETYARALKAPFTATLGISATPERDHDRGMARYVFPALGEVLYEYQHEHAIADGVVADFRVLFVGVQFDAGESLRNDELNQKVAYAKAALFREHPYLKDAKPLIEAVRILAGRDEDALARAFLSFVSERRRLLCNAHQRHAFVAWLATQPAFQQKKALLFHESIDDCARLADALQTAGVRTAAHHSRLGAYERTAVLSAFAGDGLDALVSPHTLDEGIDVPDADLAVIVAGSRVKRQSIQRMGRVLRDTSAKDHARIIRVFVEGSADDPEGIFPDKFAQRMLESGRATVSHWPSKAGTILSFITRLSPTLTATPIVEGQNYVG